MASLSTDKVHQKMSILSLFHVFILMALGAAPIILASGKLADTGERMGKRGYQQQQSCSGPSQPAHLPYPPPPVHHHYPPHEDYHHHHPQQHFQHYPPQESYPHHHYPPHQHPNQNYPPSYQAEEDEEAELTCDQGYSQLQTLKTSFNYERATVNQQRTAICSAVQSAVSLLISCEHMLGHLQQLGGYLKRHNFDSLVEIIAAYKEPARMKRLCR